MVDAHRIEPHAAHLPLVDQELHGFGRKARKVHPAHHVLILIARGIVPKLAPAGIDQDHGAGGDLAVGLLEAGERRPGSRDSRDRCRPAAETSITTPGRKELLGRDLIDRRLIGLEMVRGVEMGAQVLGRREGF